MFVDRTVLLTTNAILKRNDFQNNAKYRPEKTTEATTINSLKDITELFRNTGIKHITIEDLDEIKTDIDPNADNLDSFHNNALLLALDINVIKNCTSFFTKYFEKGIDFILVANDQMPCDFIEVIQENSKQILKFICFNKKQKENSCNKILTVDDDGNSNKVCLGEWCKEDSINNLTESETLRSLLAEITMNFKQTRVENTKNTSKSLIPIFKYSFLLDFYLYKYFFGDVLFEQRAKHNFFNNKDWLKGILKKEAPGLTMSVVEAILG